MGFEKRIFENAELRLRLGNDLQVCKDERAETPLTHKSPANGGSFATKRQTLNLPTLAGWGARIRTWEWRNQNPLPYHLATPQPGKRRNLLKIGPGSMAEIRAIRGL
jgi:hypothetical protein